MVVMSLFVTLTQRFLCDTIYLRSCAEALRSNVVPFFYPQKARNELTFSPFRVIYDVRHARKGGNKMRAITNITNRKQLATTLSELLAVPSRYDYMPNYTFTIGQVKIQRNGDITTEDLETWEKLIPFFEREGYTLDALPESVHQESAQAFEEEQRTINQEEQNAPIQANAPILALEQTTPTDEPTTPTPELTESTTEPIEPPELLTVEMSVDDLNAKQLLNLVTLFYNKQYLLNKATQGNTIFIEEAFVDELSAQPNKEHMLELLVEHQQSERLQGFEIQHGVLKCTFKKDQRVEEMSMALLRLVFIMVKYAKDSLHIQKHKIVANDYGEKFFMYSWLTSLGYAAGELKQDRRWLVKNLKGSCAFCSFEAEQKHKAKQEAKREALKNRVQALLDEENREEDL